VTIALDASADDHCGPSSSPGYLALVVTLGVDLSASPKKTAACLIEWDGRVSVETPLRGLDDGDLLDLMGRADWVGIDAPFGWPSDFLDAVTTWAEGGAWPEIDRSRLRYRETDRFVRQIARLPLSVSSDRIAVTAMRCASLLSVLGQRRSGTGGRIDRAGGDGVVEVYPGAALALWSDEAADLRLDPQGYKGPGAAEKRKALVEVLLRAAPWLNLDEPTRALCLASDDVLDALISALVARAAALGLTMPPQTMGHTGRADIEGWIHLPELGSLAGLPGHENVHRLTRATE
jgi:hypothetical protein